MTRIALTFPAAHHRGGVERISWEMARYLAPRHDVTFVGHELEPEQLGPVTPSLFPRRLRPALQPITFRRDASKRLSDLAPDVTVSLGANCPSGDVLVVNSVHRAWLEMGKTMTVGRVRVPNRARYLLLRHQVLLQLERSYFTKRSPSAVIAVSQTVIDDLVRLYDIDPACCYVIPNGFSASQCSPERSASLRASMRGELGIADDQIALLMVANELHRKGLGVLLEAVHRADDPRLHIHVVGRMAPTDFLATAERLGLSDRLHYHGATSDVARFHAAADLFVLPTQYEAFALAIVEALASGLPVITTSVPGAGDLMRHDVNGLIQTDPLDADELAGLLTAALDAERRTGWSKAAAPSVAEYEWDALMARAEDVILGAATNATTMTPNPRDTPTPAG
ncbi:MAG: glycosyltransferase family 4 protein [Acidimicrobiia bacterium]